MKKLLIIIILFISFSYVLAQTAPDTLWTRTYGESNYDLAFSIKQTSASVAIVDADHAFGHHAGSVAIQHATKIAKETGIGAVSVKNSTHFGAAAFLLFKRIKKTVSD